MKWKTGGRTYELVEGWGDLPRGWTWGEVVAVAVDGRDNVHVFSRTDHPYMVFDQDGTLVDQWGAGIFRGLHGLHVAPDDSTFFVDHANSVILKFDETGRHVFTLGTLGEHSDTGYTKDPRTPPGVRDADSVPIRNGVKYSGPPFHYPTDVAVSESGDIFVSDGYRNARVHKFDRDGDLIASWGRPGHAEEFRDTKGDPWSFHNPHGICAAGGRLYVADLENNRIQIFDYEGNFLDMWLGVSRPSKIIVDAAEGFVYVSELNDRCSILDLEGNVVARLGDEDDPDRVLIGRLGMSHDPGSFWGPHSIAKDSAESLYVAEAFGGERLLKLARTR